MTVPLLGEVVAVVLPTSDTRKKPQELAFSLNDIPVTKRHEGTRREPKRGCIADEERLIRPPVGLFLS